MKRLLCLLLLAAALPATAQPTPDHTFAGGIHIAPPYPGRPGGFSYAIEGLAIDRSDRVVFLATSDCGFHTPLIGCAFTDVRRLRENGQLDGDFGVRARYPMLADATGSQAYGALAIDARDRIIAALGWNSDRIYMVRILPDGKNDPSFGPETSPPDPTFGSVALFLTNGSNIIDVAVQPDGKPILVMGSRPEGAPETSLITLHRWTEDGLPDPSFGFEGRVYTSVPGGTGHDQGAGIALQPDGKILVTGRARSLHGYDAIVLRYLPNGDLDPTFGRGSGMVLMRSPLNTSARGRKVALLPDGRIVVAGVVFDAAFGHSRAALFRLKADGSLDGSFGISGWAIDTLGEHDGDIHDLALQADGKAIVVGYREHLPGSVGSLAAVAMRYTTSGVLDATWGSGGRFEMTATSRFSDSIAASMGIDSLGRVVVSGMQQRDGDLRWFVGRLLP
jgi:uncharacterized delta-60 repeat protein